MKVLLLNNKAVIKALEKRRFNFDIKCYNFETPQAKVNGQHLDLWLILLHVCVQRLKPDFQTKTFLTTIISDGSRIKHSLARLAHPGVLLPKLKT